MAWVGLNYVASVVGWAGFNDTVMVGSNDCVACAFTFSKTEIEVTPCTRTQRYDT